MAEPDNERNKWADMTGFITAIVAVIFGHQHGIFNALGAAAVRAKDGARATFDQLEFLWNCFWARKTYRMLVISTCVSVALLLLALLLVRNPNGAPVLPWPLLVLAAIVIVIKIIYARWMSQAIPAYVVDEAGIPERHPTYRQNAQGEWLDHDGRVLTYEVDVYRDRLTPGETGTPLRLDDNGRALRFFEHNGIWIDAEGPTEQLHPNGTPKRYNRVGQALAYFQDELGNWCDAVTGTILTGEAFLHARAHRRAIIPGDTIDRTAVLAPRDYRVRSELTNLQRLDLSVPNRNRLGRHSLVNASLLSLVDLVLVGISIIVIGLSNGPSEQHTVGGEVLHFVFGNRGLIALGGIYLLVGLLFVYGAIWAIMAAYAKTVQAMEGIADISIKQGLIILNGITVENVRSWFKGADQFIDEMKHSRFVLGALQALLKAYMLWLAAILIWPDSNFAARLILLVIVWAIATKVDRPRLKWLLVAAFLVMTFDGVRYALFGQANNLVNGTERTLNGTLGLGVPAWHLCLFVGIPSAIGAFMLFMFVGKQIEEGSGDSTVGNWFAKKSKLFALLCTTLAIVATILYFVSLTGKKVISLPRTATYAAPKPVVVTSATSNDSPQGLTATVTWNGSGDETGSEVERQEVTGTQQHPVRSEWHRIGNVPMGARSFKDTSLTPGTYYRYRITAVNEAGRSTSAPSDWTGKAAPPQAPPRTEEEKADPTPQPPAVTPSTPAKPADNEPSVRVATNGGKRKGYDPTYLANLRELNDE
jgi:hypothetical protein